MKKHQLVAIDLQHDFTHEGGICYRPRPSVDFIESVLIPFCRENKIAIHEILSDYREPRHYARGDRCAPGTWGYESIIPKEMVASRWLKCMNSPIWVRENIGNGDKSAGLPYQDPNGFSEWLEKIGSPEEVIPVLFGLTIDCCVLSTLQELRWRGYEVLILDEGVDHYSGKEEDKIAVLETTTRNWGKIIGWEKLREELVHQEKARAVH